MNYVLVGAGGTGSYLFHPLYRYLKSREDTDPNWTLHIYDGDTVESHNPERQLFDPSDVFKHKADALTAKVSDTEHLFPYNTFLGPDDLRSAIKDGDTVLIGADNMFIRARIEEHAKTLQNVTVINAGNEEFSGSVQLWVREEDKDITPPISWLHKEIHETRDEDRSALSCADIAMLPGGGQTVLANLTAATLMLAALWRLHEGHYKSEKSPGVVPWTEVQFDHKAGPFVVSDMRTRKGWETHRPDSDNP